MSQADTPADFVQRRVVFHGRVQGVGFRATTARIARRFPVTGYVRNLRDGSVELVAAGDPSVLQRFVEDIQRDFRHEISRIDMTECAGEDRLDRFEIRY